MKKILPTKKKSLIKLINNEDDRNGDSNTDRIIETIRQKMGALGIEVRGGYSFSNYAGDKENAQEFINQFKPYKEKWSND